MDTISFILPARWVDFLVFGNGRNLSAEDIARLQNWKDREGVKGDPIGVGATTFSADVHHARWTGEPAGKCREVIYATADLAETPEPRPETDAKGKGKGFKIIKFNPGRRKTKQKISNSRAFIGKYRNFFAFSFLAFALGFSYFYYLDGFHGILFGGASRSQAANTIAGRASVIDGDTISVHGQRIRFSGIDAPESGQTCRRSDGSKWRCGQVSAFALADFVGHSVVRCEARSWDRYGRIVAVCFKGETELNHWLVSEGWAVANRRNSLAYLPTEIAARLAGRGIWSGDFVMPWIWRAKKRQS